MPAARVADRSPMALLPLRESARGGQHHQQQQQQHQHHQSAGTKEQQQQQHKEREIEQEQNHQQQNNTNQSSNKSNMISAAEKSEDQCRREKELCARLMQQKDQLEEQLLARLDELKDICIAEGDLVGQLPTEIYKCLLPGETEPAVKRRVGTAFKFPQEVLTIRRRNSKDNGGGGGGGGVGPNGERQLSQLEAEIVLNRRIVAAAERLAKDKSVNKSVRKKRRKDLQMAAQRLRGLEKGLHRLRLSSSKPDVSTMADGCAAPSASIGHQAGSGFSLNSLRSWPNFYQTFRMSNTKSCPATPRGSVPDLTMANGTGIAPRTGDNANGGGEAAQNSNNSRRTTPSTAKKLHKMLSRDHLLSNAAAHPSASCASALCHHPQHSADLVPSSVSVSSLANGHRLHQPCSCSSSSSSGISSATPSLSSSSNLFGMASTAPPVPNRRSSSGSSASPVGVQANATATAASGGTAPAMPRQQQNSSNNNNNSSSHLYANIGYQSSSPYKSAYRQCHFPTLLQQTSPPLAAHPQPMTSSTSFSALKDLSSSISSSSSGRPSCCCSSASSSSTSLAAAASSQLGQIVRRLDAAHPLRCGGPPLPVVRRSAGDGNAPHGQQQQQTHCWTGSLDRRHLGRMPAPSTTATTAKTLIKKVPSSATTTTTRTTPMAKSATTIRPPAFVPHFSPPPPTRAFEELTERDFPQLITTFPALIAAADRRDNGTAIQLLDASAQFRRSISAVLDRSARGDCCELPFPRPNDRLEALLASIHRQSQVGSIVADISSSLTTTTTPNNDRSASPSSTTTITTTTTTTLV